MVTKTKRIIPCLDVKEGRVVKGRQFVDLRDAGDPVEQAAFYDAAGADELVFLDINASREGRRTTVEMVRQVAAQVSIPFIAGGGITCLAEIEALLKEGADKVSLNTAAVLNPSLVREASRHFGSRCVVVAVDARRLPGGRGWEVITHGGRRGTGRSVIHWAREVESLGAGEILLTSMDADGMNGGYDLELTAAVSRRITIPVIASGGAGEPAHFVEVFLKAGADAALAANVFHSRRHSIKEIKDYLAHQGVEVRTVT